VWAGDVARVLGVRAHMGETTHRADEGGPRGREGKGAHR
jgi:hypothetical protein